MKIMRYIIYSAIVILIFAACCNDKVQDINKYKGCIVLDQACAYSSRLNTEAYMVLRSTEDSIITIYIDNTHCNIFKIGDTIK